MTQSATRKACAVVILCSSVGVASGDPAPTIEVRTIGIPPYGFVSDTRPEGFYYDVANLLVREAGYQANNHIYPYARIMTELKTGKTDLTIMFKYEELEGHVTYVAPLPSLRTVVVGLPGSGLNSVEDLKGKTLAYLRGARFSDVIDLDPQIKKQATNDFIQGLEMLAFGRVDAIIGPLEPILGAVSQIDGGNLILGEPIVVDERTPWVQVSNKSVDRLSLDNLSRTFHDIVERGDLEAIRQKYANR